MPAHALLAEPLTAAAFAPFGSVIEGVDAGAAINGGRAVLALYRAEVRAFP